MVSNPTAIEIARGAMLNSRNLEPWRGPARRVRVGTVTHGSLHMPAHAAGRRRAHWSERTASFRQQDGRCYSAVKIAIKLATGLRLTGASAYMAADQLARSGLFVELDVRPAELATLPAGAVVVWDRTRHSPHGHISVTLGDGREVSSQFRPQLTRLHGAVNYRVFRPRGPQRRDGLGPDLDTGTAFDAGEMTDTGRQADAGDVGPRGPYAFAGRSVHTG